MKYKLFKPALLFAFLGVISCSDETTTELEEPVIVTSDDSVVFSPTIGGPNEPNQVYVNLGDSEETAVLRDTWDLGFYSGDEFRVKLNSSIYMLASKLDETDIDAVVSSDEITSLQGALQIGTEGTDVNIDNPNGDITLTAVEEIVVTDSDNKVYLVNAGFKVGTSTPVTGSVAVSGDSRGWKKIRVLRNGEGYKLLYADLEDTTHTEVTIDKSTDYNFTFFSLDTEKEVSVEPMSKDWDICFTVFSNVIDFGSGDGAYGFSDFVIQNNLGGVSTYSVAEVTAEDVEADSTLQEFTYELFTVEDVDTNNFSTNQNKIGSEWRNVFSKSVTENMFYIVKDTLGNYYKLKFTTILNANGERGYTQFIYEALE